MAAPARPASFAVGAYAPLLRLLGGWPMVDDFCDSKPAYSGPSLRPWPKPCTQLRDLHLRPAARITGRAAFRNGFDCPAAAPDAALQRMPGKLVQLRGHDRSFHLFTIMKRQDLMKWMHILALSSAFVFIVSTQIAAVSPALAVQPESKGSKPKPKKKPAASGKTPPRRPCTTR